MAKIVDQQNSNDPNYKKMSHDFETLLHLGCRSCLEGQLAHRYTEPILHRKN